MGIDFGTKAICLNEPLVSVVLYISKKVQRHNLQQMSDKTMAKGRNTIYTYQTPKHSKKESAISKSKH